MAGCGQKHQSVNVAVAGSGWQAVFETKELRVNGKLRLFDVFLSGNQLYDPISRGEGEWCLSKKNIDIFTYKQSVFSLDMKTKVAMHVPRININPFSLYTLENDLRAMEDDKLNKLSVEPRDETKLLGMSQRSHWKMTSQPCKITR